MWYLQSRYLAPCSWNDGRLEGWNIGLQEKKCQTSFDGINISRPIIPLFLCSNIPFFLLASIAERQVGPKKKPAKKNSRQRAEKVLSSVTIHR
jgi:hypothetical protein